MTSAKSGVSSKPRASSPTATSPSSQSATSSPDALRAADFGLKELTEIPFPGFATSKTWRETTANTKRCAGKNLPEVGRWLMECYGPAEGGVCGDPMIGAGGLWLQVGKDPARVLYGNEIERKLIAISGANLYLAGWGPRVGLTRLDATQWSPPDKCDFIMTSPVFRQSKTPGYNEAQQRQQEEKHVHAIGEFGKHPRNLANLTELEFWEAIFQIYRRVWHALKPGGIFALILRNRIVDQVEINVVKRHVEHASRAGFSEFLGAHWRRLRPTKHQQRKLMMNPNEVWTKREHIVVARRSS